MKRILTWIIVMVGVSAMAASASATNGYLSHGYGTQSKGMAGAGAANPMNALAVATNPAGLTKLDSRYDIGLALFSPDRQYTVSGTPSGFPGTFGLTPSTVTSDKKSFVIPNFGANWKIDDVSAVGLAVYGNGGMNTTYDAATFYGSTPTGVNLSQLFLTATYARKLTYLHSVGVSVIASYQWFKATGLQAFGAFSEDATALTDKGHDNSTGFGLRVGYLGHLLPNIRIGGSYQTKIAMSEFEEYAGLFAEEGDFDIPANWTVGFSMDASEKLTVAVDMQQILYSGVKSVGNPFDPTLFQQGLLLGNAAGPGFGWQDMTVWKFGAQYNASKDLALRAGYSVGDNPITESEVMFNILAPGVMEQHLTFGLTKTLASGNEISLAVMHALSNSVSGPNPMEAPAQQTIDLEMKQWEFEIGFSF